MGSPVKRCFGLMRAFAPREAVRYAGCSLLSALSVPLLALLIGQCVNGAAGAGEGEGRFWVSFAALAAVLLGSVLAGHFLRVSDVLLAEALNRSCTPRIIDKLNHMEYAYFDSASAADILECAGRDPAQSLARLYKTLTSCISLTVRIFGLTLLYFRLSAAFGTSLGVLMAAEVVIGIRSNREFNRLYGEELPEERKLAYLGDLFTQKGPVFDLKINQSAGYVKGLRDRLAGSVLKERVRISLKAERWYLLGVCLMTAWTAALLGALIGGRLAGTLELGTFCTLLGSYPLLMQVRSGLSYRLSSMGNDWFFVHALEELLEFQECRASDKNMDAPPQIVFSHVSFRYPGTSRFVLRDVSFTLSHGETLALAGDNGSGKSTVIKLICGLYAPTEGTVTVGGVPAAMLSQEDRTRLFSAVFQDFLTYDETIAENVALGGAQKSCGEREITEALRRSELDGFVRSLPQGLQTPLGHLEEGGVELSGGQRQRLAIARACMSDAWFYLLDEPAAALDPVAESRLYQSFAGIIRGKGAVLVSHRLASAAVADTILVLSGGRIVQRGTHSGLMAEPGLYREMFEKQSSWYGGEETANGI